jgi:hypothetical protein
LRCAGYGHLFFCCFTKNQNRASVPVGCLASCGSSKVAQTWLRPRSGTATIVRKVNVNAKSNDTFSKA